MITQNFMDRGNFLPALDLWGSAEIQLVIPAGFWRLQLVSSDVGRLKNRAMTRDEFKLGNSSAGCLTTQCFPRYSTCYHMQEGIAVFLEVQSSENVVQQMLERSSVWITELLCNLQGQKSVNNYPCL